MEKEYQHREQMESQRQIEKKYQKLIYEVSNNDFYKIDLSNRVNCYSCKCEHITKTIDIDAGVTPFMFTCEKCGGDAHSSFFKDIAPNQKPTFEWYRPDLKQVLKLRSKPGLLDHILSGGLDYRRIKS
jgi:regulator of RNase E activity RraB